MLSRERVTRVIRHEKPDRIPVYAWVRANLTAQICAAYGSVEAFEDHYEFDLSHVFGGPPTYHPAVLAQLRQQRGGSITPRDLLEVPTCDPDDENAYRSVSEAIRHHKDQRGRFVYMQTPGIFEALNDAFSIENHLAFMIEYEDDLRLVYERQARWNRRFANNVLDLGIDMVHVSDDWGAQNTLLFSPKTWWNLIYPYHKVVCDSVKSRNAFVSLHSDGNINQVVGGIIKLGYDVVHPWQESAGMDLNRYRTDYMNCFTVMGGLDIQTTLGFGKLDVLRSEIERIMGMFASGGLLLCTTHFVQAHCTVDELAFAMDVVRELSRKPPR